jgi:hypothetical protein
MTTGSGRLSRLGWPLTSKSETKKCHWALLSLFATVRALSLHAKIGEPLPSGRSLAPSIPTGGEQRQWRDEQMPTHSKLHFYLNWAKERVDEMDAILASLESKVSELHADARVKAGQVLADIRKKRDDFRAAIKKQAEADEAAWIKAKAQLESDWSAFETEVKRYVETFGKQIEQQQATFKVQAAAQLKAWREAADKFQIAGKEFAAERRAEVDTTVRMNADAAAAEEKLQKKVHEAGTQSWSALTAALPETRRLRSRQSRGAGSIQAGRLASRSSHVEGAQLRG